MTLTCENLWEIMRHESMLTTRAINFETENFHQQIGHRAVKVVYLNQSIARNGKKLLFSTKLQLSLWRCEKSFAGQKCRGRKIYFNAAYSYK